MVLGIDPGRQKCGIAVLRHAVPLERLHKSIVATAMVAEKITSLLAQYPITVVVVGDATGSRTLLGALEASLPASIALVRVPEYGTTQVARQRYWQENPPQGWRRLVPASLQQPSEPWDDYSAVLLCESYIKTFEFPKKIPT